ncbi:CLUMA_CG017688, isoform A [Clunio marinus]|uniref:CLUMA_CG017688, isoform A n=1 Tax=Clunio marinus TaxID=568069 RepID=A0A1J1IYI8_9DIPT|nr:CLUMA_CG017688, isoform A [Clunio marinus]
MVVDIKLCKEDGKPFGFRLIGGADFEIPLTCSRVIEGSTAGLSGLQEGDVVVRINDKPTINMTHEDAHFELVAAGNEFTLGVLRATNVLPEVDIIVEEAPTVTTVAPTEIEVQKEQARIDKIIPDASVTDEEIAELLSGEAEVLKGHGVLGVNFKKMMPKAGVFKQSEVFQVLNDEQLKTKAEREREEKHQWTTFLQKPKRPPPLRATQHTLTNTYKPLIVKQPKPKCAPDYREATPEPPQVEVKEQIEHLSESVTEQKTEIVEQNDVQDQVECQFYEAEVSSQTVVTTTTTTTTSCEEVVTFEELAADATGESVNEVLVEEEVKSEEVSVLSSAFAEQLANVQSQLMALSHLPKTIQSTLDDITKQLQSLIPPSKLKQTSIEPEKKVDEKEEEINVTSEDIQVHVDESTETKIEMTCETIHIVETTTETIQSEQKQPSECEESISFLSQKEIEDYEECQMKFRELWERKREKKLRCSIGPWAIKAVREVEDPNCVKTQEPKDAKTELSAELKQKVTEDRNMKQKKAKGFRGLQPQERPITLPGGRKWRNAKDAMNEEMIAEIISSQAELIMGSTLGVNFLKYQKPEKDLSFLKNSETYRTIHHLAPAENGIEKRPAVVAAEEDMLKCSSPNPLNQNSS